MKYAKKMGLAVIAAVALNAMLGVGSASAAKTVLCEELTNAPQYCTSYGNYPKGTEISASQEAKTTVDIESGLGRVMCSESTITGETSADSGEPLPVSVSAWTLGGCVRKKINKTTEGCTVTAVKSAPYSGAFNRTSGGSGTLSIGSGGSGNPGWTIVCGSVINCTMTIEPGFSYSSGDLVATKVPLQTKGSFCPEIPKLTGTYVVSYPYPAHLAEPVAPMTALCESGDPLYYCEKEERYNKGSQFVDKMSTVVFDTGEYASGDITCESGELGIEPTADYGEPLPVNVSLLSLVKCKWPVVGKLGCTVTAWTGSAGISKAPFTEEGVSTGYGKLEGPGPEVYVACGSFIECKLSPASTQATFVLGEPGKVEKIKMKWTTSGGICPTSVTLEPAAFSTAGPLMVTDAVR